MKALQVFLIALCLCLPAYSQDWVAFEQLMNQKAFQEASDSLSGWPAGPDRDIAQVESFLALGRPGLAWDLIGSVSLNSLPQHLRSRFFLLRGQLQEKQSEYKLARMDFAQALRESPSAKVRAQVLGQQVELYLKLGDKPAVQETMESFSDLPDQPEWALLAASKRASEEGRASESLAILRLLRRESKDKEQHFRAHYFQLLETRALWKTGRPQEAYKLARELDASPHIRKDRFHWLACLLWLEHISREMKEHRDKTLDLVQQRVDEFPLASERARLLLTSRKKEAIRRAVKEARECPEPRLLVLALLESSYHSRGSGKFEQAQGELTEAASIMEKHPQNYRGEGFFRNATRGEIFIEQAKLAQRQGKLKQSVELLQKAVKAEPGPYYAKWRAYAFRDLTKIMLGASDYHQAREAFFSGLEEIESAPPEHNKAYMLTVLFNAFFETHRLWNLEQLSLGMVGEFDPLGRLIMKELAQHPSELEWTLAAYREWVAEVRLRGDGAKLSEALAFQGQYLTSLGRFAEAESALLKSYEVATDQNLIDMRQWSQMNLSRLFYDQGQLEKASSHIQKSVDILAEHDTHYSSYSVGLATLLAKLGQPEEALAIYNQHPNSGACLMSAAVLLGQRGRWKEALAKSERAIDLFTERRLPEILFQARIQKARALAHLGRELESETVFQQLLSEAEFGQDLGLLQAWVEVRQFLQVAHSDLDELLAKAIEAMDKRLPRELIPLQSKTSNSQFLTRLHRMRGRDSELDQALLVKESELLTIQSRLNEDKLFVHILAVEDRIIALLITSQTMRIAEIQIDKNRRKNLLTKLLQRLSRAKSSPSSLKALNRELASLLLPALQPELAQAKELEVLAAGEFRKLPFEILLEESGRSLLDRVDVSYADALRPGLAKPAPLKEDRLLVGGSDLPGVASELKKVGELIGEHQRAESLQELKQAARSSSLVHVATHSDIKQDAVGEGHFLLGDQKISFQDIYALKLPPGAVVVLSSCRSASGGQGRELVSLSSAFLFGGASTAIGSLWRVDDRTTAVFFDYFYRELSQGLSPGQALSAAKKKLKTNPTTSHPYFWAPFVLYGRAG